jgi:hypothetical protein
MIWLTWRQFRTQALAAAVLLAALAVYLLITGTQLRHSYSADLASCAAQGRSACSGLFNSLQGQYDGPYQITGLLVMAAPALIGIFWGAPVVAGELERGTHHMAWNQSVSRTRWLAVKLAVTGFAAVLTAGLLSLLVTWWASPLDAIAASRFGTDTFNGRDIAPLGYAAFAFALGVTLGLLIRRTLPAMAATLAVFLVVQVLMTAGVRPHLLPATSTETPVNQATMSQAIRVDLTDPLTVDLPAPAGAWILSQSPALYSSGQPVYPSEISACVQQFLDQSTSAVKGEVSGFGALGACLAPKDLHIDLTYQPADRYWPLQWIETALYTALAALLMLVCFLRIRRLRG